MYYLILHTPPDLHNSEYSAHLIEHIKLAVPKNIELYFPRKRYDGTSYSYYSTYMLDIQDRKEVDEFVEELIIPISWIYLAREQKRIREELSEREYSKKVVESVGRIWYGKNYRYARTTQVNLMQVQSYHTQYYTRDHIHIYSKNDIITTDDYNTELGTLSKVWFRIGHDRNICIHSDMSPMSLFIFFLIERLFDNYLEYLDTLDEKYWPRYTIQGEHPDRVWISYEESDTNDLSCIPDTFIQAFIWDVIWDIIKEDAKNKIPEYDLISLFQFQIALSMKSKIEIIENIDRYYDSIQKMMRSQ
jgi:hypothetical protein